MYLVNGEIIETTNPRTSIGSHEGAAEIVLQNDETVCAHHAAILYDFAGTSWLVDCASRTFLHIHTNQILY